MGKLLNPGLLREYSLRCRRAAKIAADREERRLFVHHALALAHLAEALERKRPLAAQMLWDAIAAHQRILAKPSKRKAPIERPQPLLADEAALHRARIWRQKAEECRVVGEQMMFHDTRAVYFRLAADYEIMARREEERVAVATKRRQAGHNSGS